MSCLTHAEAEYRIQGQAGLLPMRQLTLDLPKVETEFVPSTRYQGSKAKLVRWIRVEHAPDSRSIDHWRVIQ